MVIRVACSILRLGDVIFKKCFLLKKLVQIRSRFREKRKKTHTLIPKNSVTEPKASLL